MPRLTENLVVSIYERAFEKSAAVPVLVANALRAGKGFATSVGKGVSSVAPKSMQSGSGGLKAFGKELGPRGVGYATAATAGIGAVGLGRATKSRNVTNVNVVK